MATFGEMVGESQDTDEQKKKMASGDAVRGAEQFAQASPQTQTQSPPITSPMVTAIHGPADAIHPMVAALHGGGAQTPTQPKVNTFGAAPQTQSSGGSEVNGSVGQSLMRAQQPAQPKFHGVLSDESQGGRINSLLSNQASDAANIRAEKASNAPMEREHMAHMWADEDIQRHLENQMRQLELERGKYQFHEAQRFPGSPLGPHWAALKEKVITDPASYQMTRDASGKMVKGGLLPQHQQFIDYIDQQMRGLTEEGQQQPQTAPPVAQGKVDEAKTPHKDAGAFNTFMSGAFPTMAQGGLIGAAARIPNPYIKFPAIAAASLAHGPLQRMTDAIGGVTDEDRVAHPVAAKAGDIAGVVGGLVGGISAKNKDAWKNMTRKAGTPPVAAAGKTAAQQAPKGVGGNMFPKPSTTTSKAGGIGNQFNGATEEAQKPLQGNAPQSANGSATAATTSPQAAQWSHSPSGTMSEGITRVLKNMGFSDQQIASMSLDEARAYVLKGIPKGAFGK